jgi:hypothetical protein
LARKLGSFVRSFGHNNRGEAGEGKKEKFMGENCNRMRSGGEELEKISQKFSILR